MDFQNNSQSENNSSYRNSAGNNQGGYIIQSPPGQKLSMASMIFAVIAIFSTAVVPVIFPCIFGGLSIIFAILSKGYDKKMLSQSIFGISVSTLAIVLNVSVMVGAVYLYNNNTEFHQKYNEVVKETYGTSFDDLLKQYEDMYNTEITQ